MISVGVLTLSVKTHASDNWPQWRGPQRTGIGSTTLQTSPQTQLAHVWSADVGTGFSSMAVSEGRLVTSGNIDDQDVITCLDAQTGQRLWDVSYKAALDPNLFEGGPTATPAIHNSTVFTIARQGLVHAINLKSGEIQWTYDVHQELGLNVPTWGFAGSPLIHDGRVFLNCGSHGVCLDAHSGKLVWTSPNDVDAGYSSPLLVSIGDQSLLLLLNAKALNGVRPDTGELAWSERWITRYGINAADPLVIDDQHVIVSAAYGKGTGLIRFNATESELVWRDREIRIHMSPGVVLDSKVYTINGDEGTTPNLVCFDAKTGDVHWSETGFGAGSLIAAGNTVLVLSEKGTLTGFSAQADQYAPLFSVSINSGKCWTPPAIAGKLVYSRNAAGHLACHTFK